MSQFSDPTSEITADYTNAIFIEFAAWNAITLVTLTFPGRLRRCIYSFLYPLSIPLEIEREPYWTIPFDDRVVFVSQYCELDKKGEERITFDLNTSYLTDSCISFTLKLESRTIFCSDRSIRSSTYGKKNISYFPPCGKLVIFVNEFLILLKTSK